MDNLVAWAAGFFDAQGHVLIQIGHGSRNPCHSLVCEVITHEIAIAEALCIRWGGSISTQQGGLVLYKHLPIVYRWRVGSVRALRFLQEIRSGLRSKTRAFQTSLAIQFQRYKRDARGTTLSSNELAWREMHRQLVKEAKTILDDE